WSAGLLLSLVGVAVDEAAENGEQQDADIEPERPVFDIEEVVLEPFAEGCVASEAVDLGPTGHTGLDVLSEHVAAPVFAEALDEFGALGAGADEGHVALEDVEELGEFVEAGSAEPA